MLGINKILNMLFFARHSDELIQRLEQAGLGYHVDADKTTDKLGRWSIQHFVYIWIEMIHCLFSFTLNKEEKKKCVII